jgi:cell division protein FtsW
MNQTITNRIKATTAWADPNRYGRSDRSTVGRWFWEIDRVLLFMLALLIGFGLIAVAAASPAVAQRYSGGSVRVDELYYFYRQIAWIALSMPVMIAISMQPRDRLRRLSLVGALFCMVALATTKSPAKTGDMKPFELSLQLTKFHAFVFPLISRHGEKII